MMSTNKLFYVNVPILGGANKPPVYVKRSLVSKYCLECYVFDMVISWSS